MDPFGVFKVSASALEAQRKRLNIIASNMANVHTTKTENGGPYKRKDIVFSTVSFDSRDGILEGVKAANVVEDPAQPVLVFNPGHPDADSEGYVAMPNISIVEEMANMIMATRAYEANVAVFNISKTLFSKTLEIGR